jgi:hypothetical protein
MPTDRHTEFLALWATFTILTTVILAMRFYVRIAVVRQFGYDDSVMVLAAVHLQIVLGMTTANLPRQIWHVLILMVGFSMSHFGMGRHIQDISKTDAMEAIKWAIFEPTISAFCMAFVKVSLCLLLIRIGIGKAWQIVLVSLIGISFIDTIDCSLIDVHHSNRIVTLRSPRTAIIPSTS